MQKLFNDLIANEVLSSLQMTWIHNAGFDYHSWIIRTTEYHVSHQYN